MEIEDKKSGNVLIVKILNKRLDAQGAIDFKEKMLDYIASGSHSIVLNISEVDFVDSSGLGAMVSVLKALGKEGGLVICGATGSVMRMLKLTRMNKVFGMFERQKEAVAALST